METMKPSQEIHTALSSVCAQLSVAPERLDETPPDLDVLLRGENKAGFLAQGEMLCSCSNQINSCLSDEPGSVDIAQYEAPEEPRESSAAPTELIGKTFRCKHSAT